MGTESTFRRDLCIICGEDCTSGIRLKWVEELRYCQRLVVYGDPAVGDHNIAAYLQTQLAGIRYDMANFASVAHSWLLGEIRAALELLARDLDRGGSKDY
jgi:hypothetical protein